MIKLAEVILVKRVFKILLSGLIAITLVSCFKNENKNINENEKLEATLICPDGLPAIAISNLIDKDNKIENEKIVIKHSIEKSTDLLLSELMKGDADLAIVPSNLALQSYKKQLGYKIAGTIGWGALYLVSSEDILDLTQLEGCEIYNTGKGLTPDIIFRRILNQNNVNEENIKFSYVGAASELAPLVISEQAKYAILPEPALSTVLSKNKNIKIILNLNEEWKKENNVMEGYPQSTLLIKEDFYNKLKESNLYDELINRFIDSEK